MRRARVVSRGSALGGEERLDQHERGIQHAKGAMAAFGVLFTLLEVAIRYMRER